MDVVTVDSAAGEDVGDATSQRIDTTERGGATCMTIMRSTKLLVSNSN